MNSLSLAATAAYLRSTLTFPRDRSTGNSQEAHLNERFSLLNSTPVQIS
jgi:hypothetical protein